ncbi:unnamed protein product [Pocillopora meandrina]|uniref:Fibrinogen C-terminal domain-containing protein n=1 Tax=Pocillopora meandrina TaxID=46732 RepID=A0AAU9XRX2_9CNID|nr:unnamed protein product [Pocillopora meandrina]
MEVFSFWFILASYSVKTIAQQCKLTQRSEHGLVLLDHVYKSFTVDRLASCYIACNSQPTCQSLNFRLSDKTCQFNKETKTSCPASLKQNEGFIYADNPDRALLGSVPFKAAKSCQHIIQSGDSTGNGEYWVDPQGTGNSFKAFCDMKTDGGWMMVLNVISPRTQSSRWNGTAEQTFQGMRNYGNGKMAITKSAMKQVRAYINFAQIRFHCSKEKGTTFHVRTTLNNKGTEVVRFFSGERDERPDSCDSFVRMDGDNSRLAQNCAMWANDGKWGHVSHSVGENCLYNHAAYVRSRYHWIISIDGQWKCDDLANHLSTGDFWKVYIR